MTKRISAQKPARPRYVGPTLHTLAQKMRIMGDDIVQRLGRPALRRYDVRDAHDPLSWMLAKGILTQAEFEAGLTLLRLRHNLFGFGVVPPASFYHQFVSETPADEDERPVREDKTDAEVLEEAQKKLARYEEALAVMAKVSSQVKQTVQRMVSTDWWPENDLDAKMVKVGLHMLALEWKTGEQSMADEKPILCLDYDGVIHSFTSGWQGVNRTPDPPVPGSIEFIHKASDVFKIAVHSSRSRNGLGIAAMRDYLRKHMTLYFKGDFGAAWALLSKIDFPHFKPNSFVSIDDRAVRFNGDWSSPEYDPLRLVNLRTWSGQ
jgi:hypothetical protein